MNKVFKINTATEKAGNEKISVVHKILFKCRMNYGEWANILFETGCTYVEKHITDKQMQHELLTDKQFGFWDWWIMLFIEDDETLLHFNNIITVEIYAEEKKRLLHLSGTKFQFECFLKSNKKIQ